ncbi:alpha-hydroxy-acid oxidizing protein [Porcincola sp. LCP21S3_C12]|uniref:alpha-hydroxy-acid oxidizing protein n=1 Tax=Porcincola sp. LCP21S3_C12 TaxID=3438798 RepID=UPI003F998FEB
MEKEANWPGPEGLIPALEKNAANASLHTRRFLDEILIEERIIGTRVADLTMKLWGSEFTSPIMMPAFSHLNKAGLDHRPMEEYAQAAKNLGIVNWVGMESDADYAKIAEVGSKTIRIIKPFADHEKIKEQMTFAVKRQALAVGIDIDHSIGKDGNVDVVDGEKLGTLTAQEIKEFADFAHKSGVPFVAKGVLSTRDAALCEKAGADAIVVSHHHGRMPFAVPPAMILPDIRKVSGKMKVFADCSVDDGRDAYKLLALGADAVSTGRAILPGLLKEGTPAVERKIQQMNDQLKELMGYTGVATLDLFDATVLWYHGRPLK